MARGLAMHVLVAACALRYASAEEKYFTDAQALLQSRVDASSAQPEYARPHVHGYEKAKEALINGGKEIDSMLKDTKKALMNLTEVLHTRGALDKRCNISKTPEGSALYLVDNSQLQASTNGVGYRFRKALWDRDLRNVAHWGSTVRGVDHGDGWLQVGDCFLPMDVQDVPVMQLQQHEVVVLSGPATGRWLKCFIEGKNAEDDSYHIYIPHAPTRHRHVSNIPLKLLRRPEVTSDKSDGVLLFWAVSGKERTIEMVQRNIQHLRDTYSGKADVYLVHIDDGKEDWMERTNETWYKNNVQFSEERKIPKQLQASASMLFASSYYPPQLRLAKNFLPELLAKRQYDWVWILDEDIDFSGSDLNKLFGDAEKTGSLIVGPSVTFEDRLGQRALEKMYLPGCSIGNPMCFVHMPKPRCQYRYVNFVEAMFPIMKPEVFKEMFESCQGCESQPDRIWCSRSANQLIHSPDQACAILDQVSVVHTNGKTLRKWEEVGRNQDNLGAVQRAFPGDWVDTPDIGVFKCVEEGEEEERVAEN